MTMEQAATFLASSILIVLGFLIIFIGIVVANNIGHKYWRPVKSFSMFGLPFTDQRFIYEDDQTKSTKHESTSTNTSSKH
jgi:hypothetical protein